MDLSTKNKRCQYQRQIVGTGYQQMDCRLPVETNCFVAVFFFSFFLVPNSTKDKLVQGGGCFVIRILVLNFFCCLLVLLGTKTKNTKFSTTDITMQAITSPGRKENENCCQYQSDKCRTNNNFHL